VNLSLRTAIMTRWQVGRFASVSRRAKEAHHDRIEVALIPVLLGGGIPLLPPPADRAVLKLCKGRAYEKTGTIGLEYDIVRSNVQS